MAREKDFDYERIRAFAGNRIRSNQDSLFNRPCGFFPLAARRIRRRHYRPRTRFWRLALDSLDYTKSLQWRRGEFG